MKVVEKAMPKSNQIFPTAKMLQLLLCIDVLFEHFKQTTVKLSPKFQ